MPLFYFVTSSDVLPAKPADGFEFVDASGAWEEATTTASEVLREIGAKMTSRAEWSIEVQNEDHQTIRTLRIRSETPQ